MAQIMTNVNNYIYELDGKLYVNLTNACTNDCLFCIRSQKDDVMGANMWLNEKPDFSSVINQLNDKQNLIKNGVTFCGYGEPLLELDLVLQISKYIKENSPDTKIKINTNGHANAVYKKDVTLMFKGLIDEVSISLNAQNDDLYSKLCRPKIKNAYKEMLNFAIKCVETGIKTTLTVVTGYKDFDVNIKECEKIAENLGAVFRERPWIENGY